MMNWPDNKRIAVMMAFDLDAETMWTTHGDGSTAHMTNLSRGAYGPKQGVPRILDKLDSHQVKATFFIPGVGLVKLFHTVKTTAIKSLDTGKLILDIICKGINITVVVVCLFRFF